MLKNVHKTGFVTQYSKGALLLISLQQKDKIQQGQNG